MCSMAQNNLSECRNVVLTIIFEIARFSVSAFISIVFAIMSSLAAVVNLICTAINAKDLKDSEKFLFVQDARAQCSSLKGAHAYIGHYNLLVVIPEDLANAIQAEGEPRNTVPVPAASAPEASATKGLEGSRAPEASATEDLLHLDDFVLRADDYRFPFDVRIQPSESLTENEVEWLRKEKAARLDSASLRPLTKELIEIHSASRESTAQLFAQDKIYRSKGGERPIFDVLTEPAKRMWASRLVSQTDTVFRRWEDIPYVEKFIRISRFYLEASLDNPHPLDSALADVAMTVTSLDEEALDSYLGTFGKITHRYGALFNDLAILDRLEYLWNGLGPPDLKEIMTPYLKTIKSIPAFYIVVHREFSILLRGEGHRAIVTKSTTARAPKEKQSIAKDVDHPSSPPRSAYADKWSKEERFAHHRKKQEEEASRVAIKAAELISATRKSASAVSAEDCLNCTKPGHRPWKCTDFCHNPMCKGGPKRHRGTECPYYKLMQQETGHGPKGSSSVKHVHEHVYSSSVDYDDDDEEYDETAY